MLEKQDLVLYVYAKIELPIPRDGFDESDMTYEEFFDKVLADADFKKSMFIDFLCDKKDILIDELVILIEANQLPIIANLQPTARDVE